MKLTHLLFNHLFRSHQLSVFIGEPEKISAGLIGGNVDGVFSVSEFLTEDKSSVDVADFQLQSGKGFLAINKNLVSYWVWIDFYAFGVGRLRTVNTGFQGLAVHLGKLQHPLVIDGSAPAVSVGRLHDDAPVDVFDKDVAVFYLYFGSGLVSSKTGIAVIK